MEQFSKEIEGMLNHFKLYEIKSNQSAALAEIPQYLLDVCQAKVESLGLPPEEREGVVKDLYLLELMSWFKNDFFAWMDTPSCPNCSGSTQAVGNAPPTTEELQKSAGRVEIFTCVNCEEGRDGREVARFPRYNHPVVLLKTRVGRCGEWANCFGLLCRASGFEVRHVRDWTDHVWIEVFSSSLKPNRWVHVDPCENSYDSPLLYDRGWGKQLSYVIAMSQDDVQDVTWRYVQEGNINGVLARRNLIKEEDLVTLIIRTRKRLQSNVGETRKRILEGRLIQELVEFIYPRGTKEVKDSEILARESGSLAWRLARKELGSNTGAKFIWKIGTGNTRNLKFTLIYDCSKDVYTVGEKSDGSFETKRGWRAGVYESDNLFRKEETDWKMVYLARKEQSTNGQAKICWQFNLDESDAEYLINSVHISASIAIFHPSSSILLTLIDENGTEYKLVDTNRTNNGLLIWNSNETFQKCRCLALACTLQGGEGNNGWQHAQLFRQSLNSDSFALKVVLNLVYKNA